MSSLGVCGKCSQVTLYIFTMLFWASGLAVLIFATWVLVDPRRSYVLETVNYIDHDPLLKLVAYIFVGVGCLSVVVGFIGCCGALNQAPCMLVTFSLFLAVMIIVELSAGVVAIVFKDQIKRTLKDDLWTMVRDKYGHESPFTTTVDKLQEHFMCCGATSSADWNGSEWQGHIDQNNGQLYPPSCCTRTAGVVSSLARCQQPIPPTPTHLWRHEQQQCCGGQGPEDYSKSWWQINKSEGRIWSVPISCCKQTQNSRPPHSLQAIDSRCIFYEYGSGPAIASVNQQGCYQKLLDWFDLHAHLFIAMALGLGVFQLFGIVLSCCLCVNIGKGSDY